MVSFVNLSIFLSNRFENKNVSLISADHPRSGCKFLSCLSFGFPVSTSEENLGLTDTVPVRNFDNTAVIQMLGVFVQHRFLSAKPFGADKAADDAE